ncbi:MAG: hypothetical protein JNG88_06440 [Phycisphaerales bacterium]|nr:hypothetical protein [Phycisphaerales bacterium]
MSAMPTDLVHDRLLRPLEQLRRRARWYIALDGLSRFAWVLLVSGVVQLALDYWLRFPVEQRIAVNLVITVFWIVFIHRYFLRPLGAPVADDTLAMAVDRVHPELHDRLATAVQFARGAVGDAAMNSPQLIAAVITEAAQKAPQAAFADALNHARARRRFREFAAIGGIILLACIIARPMMVTWFWRNWLLAEVPWPQKTYIRPAGFESGQKRVPIGDELEIIATIEGEAPTTTEVIWWTRSGKRGREPMTLRGGTQLEASIGIVNEDVSFRIVGGDERTRDFLAQAVERPRIEAMRVTLFPPDYAGLPSIDMEQQVVLEVLRGAVLEFDARLNKSVVRAQFLPADKPGIDCEAIEPRRIRIRLPTMPPQDGGGGASGAARSTSQWPVVLENGAYHFELLDADGWSNLRPVRYTIKVVADRPPVCELRISGVGQLVTPSAELSLAIKCSDAYGMASASLATQVDTDPSSLAPLLGMESRMREYSLAQSLAIAPMQIAPGRRLRIWVESSDLDPSGPNVGQSTPIEMRVVTIEELLADLARREMELRREFERLTSEQRVLYDTLSRIVGDVGESPAAPPAQQIAALARRQTSHAARVLAISRQFEQVLAELKTNKVMRAEDERRLADRIIRPLETLARESIPRAGERISGLRQSATANLIAQANASQDEILRQMREILANMLEWEGYREAIALLREIITQQQELRGATLDAVEKQLESILGEEPAEVAPTSRPKP